MDSGIRRSDGNSRKNLKNPREYPHKTKLHAEHFAAGSMGVLVLVFLQLFSKSTEKI